MSAPIDLQPFLSMGISGLVLAAVVLPLIKWLMSELSAQRQAFTETIGNHMTEEMVLLGRLEAAVVSLQATLERIDKNASHGER